MEIDVLRFDDSRKFLQDLIFERKQVGLRALARRSGFKSPSVLSLICTGKRRWTAESSERIANGLELIGKEREYFLQLTKLDRAPSPEEGDRLHGRLSELRRRRDESVLEARQLPLLSTWYHPAILALLATDNFQSDVNWIAARLGDQVTLSQIRSAIGDLINLGLARYDEQRRLVPAPGPFTTGDEVPSLHVRGYHRTMIQRGEAAVAGPLDEREIMGLTINIARGKLPALKARLRQLMKNLNEELSAEERSDQVYQLNLQFFPLTQPEAKP